MPEPVVMNTPLYHMLDVSCTLLITLYARARETMHPNPIIRDHRAVEMIAIIREEIKGSTNPIHRKILRDSYNDKLAVSMALRSRRFDRYVSDFLSDHPDGVVVNLGCGLDTRFDRMDNGSVRWFDIDFPEVIELRRRFMRESPRHRFIAGSILDEDWFGMIPSDGPYLILAEGVFMYLLEPDVKVLLRRVGNRFPGAELVCEVTNIYWVRRMKSRYLRLKFKHQLGMTGGAVFSFGIPYGDYFEEWNPDYRFLDEWTYFDDREKRLGWFRWFAVWETFRKVQWTVHYRIGAVGGRGNRV